MPLLHRHTVDSFDGRSLNVFASAPVADLPDIVLVLPFAVRHDIAQGLYDALADRCNLVTWESRFVLDLERDAPATQFEAALHAADLLHVASTMFDHRRAGDEPGRPVDVIGYCSGAGIAMLAASMSARAVRRLALVSGEYALPSHACARTSFQNDVAVILPMAAASLVDAGRLAERINAGSRAARSEFHDHVSIPFSSAEHLHRFGLNYVAYDAVDLRRVARSLTQPTVLVSLGEDQQVTSASARLVAAEIPSATVVELPGGDHYELCRGAAPLVEAVMGFLSTND